MMKKLLILVGLLEVIWFTSCSSLASISYERLCAADVNYPEQIRKVGVVNSLPLFQKCTLDTIVLPVSLVGNGKLTTETMAQEIAAADYFDQVVICDSVLECSDNTSIKSSIDSLFQVLDVDLLFILTRLDIQLSEGSFFVSNVPEPIPTVEAFVNPGIEAYVKGREMPLFVVNKTDTIIWDAISTLNLDQIIDESSEYAAIIPMKHLLPYWQNVSRYYFDGGNVAMRDAGVCVREQDWDTAASLWEQVYDSKKGRLKSRAAYNLALYYELKDDFSKAMDFLSSASELTRKETLDDRIIRYYQIQLMEQVKNYQKLKVQMNRFEYK